MIALKVNFRFPPSYSMLSLFFLPFDTLVCFRSLILKCHQSLSEIVRPDFEKLLF